jgi:hypothetical protein
MNHYNHQEGLVSEAESERRMKVMLDEMFAQAEAARAGAVIVDLLATDLAVDHPGFKLAVAGRRARPVTMSMEILGKDDLYIRAGLADGSTLHLSQILDADFNPAENTFASLRKEGEEVWGVEGSEDAMVALVNAKFID